MKPPGSYYYEYCGVSLRTNQERASKFGSVSSCSAAAGTGRARNWTGRTLNSQTGIYPVQNWIISDKWEMP